jgi:hypothetical protein
MCSRLLKKKVSVNIRDCLSLGMYSQIVSIKVIIDLRIGSKVSVVGILIHVSYLPLLISPRDFSKKTHL